MFVLLSTYEQPPEVVAEVLPRHSAWVVEQYQAGRMLVSGRQQPPTGGVLIARGEGRDDILEWVASDPFALEGVASYSVHQFDATDFPKRSEHFDAFVSALQPNASSTS